VYENHIAGGKSGKERKMENKIGTYFYNVIHSPHDGGYYAEIWDVNGKDVAFDGDIHVTRNGARKEAARWIAAHNKIAVLAK